MTLPILSPILSKEEQALQAVIQAARSKKKTLLGKDQSRGVTLEGAYRIQQASRGDRVLKGYKLGLISPAKQEQMGIQTPLYGPIYADTVYQNSLSLSAFIQPRMEPEIVAVLRDNIPPGASPGKIAQAVGGYFLGVDILDSVWEGYKFNVAEVVADNTSCGGFLMGQVMMSAMPGGSLQMFIDGEPLTEGPIAALGSPPQHLAWLASTVGGLERGMIIFFGSPAAAVPAKTGTLEVIDSSGNAIIAKING